MGGKEKSFTLILFFYLEREKLMKWDIIEKKITENARKLYNLVIKYPMSRLAKRSRNFKYLELKANMYKKEK